MRRMGLREEHTVAPATASISTSVSASVSEANSNSAAVSAVAPATEALPARGIIELSFFHLFWIFVLCSIVGLAVETVVSYPIDGVWKDRAGLLWGPFSPIYGVGAVLMTVALNRFKNAPGWFVFAVSAVVGGAFELFAGWFWETTFGIVAWSYADQPFNIGGYTCLGISLVWGAAGYLWMRAMPSIVGFIDSIPKNSRKWLTAALSVFLAFDIAMTFIGFSCWFDRQMGETPVGFVQTYFAEHYGDDFMAQRFQTMSMWTSLADRPTE